MIYRIFRKLFSPSIEKYVLLSRIVFKFRLAMSGNKNSDLLILATVTKSGTHYIRFLISYYLLLLEKNKSGQDVNEILPNQFIVDEYLPNSWHSAYRFFVRIRKPTNLLKHLGLKDIPRSHLRLREKEWKGFKVLHTYRSLSDQAVVSYETKYKCDRAISEKYQNPWELFQNTYEDNIDQINSFKNSDTKGINFLRIEYGQIFKSPENTLALVLMWLGEEPDRILCKKAAELASLTPSILVGAGEKWQRQTNDIIDDNYLKNFYAKYSETGAIDSAKDYFDSRTLEKINNICKLKG